jgi:hypothetical protein
MTVVNNAVVKMSMQISLSYTGFISFGYVPSSGIVNGNGVVSSQKISKFFVSHMEESMAGHISVSGVY